MKYALAAVALAVLAKAQSISDLPSCAVPCLEDSVSENTDCDTDDAACICENFATVQGGAAGCILSGCGSDTAIEEVLPAAEALCAGGGSGGGDDEDEGDDSSSMMPPASTSMEPEPTTTYVTPEPTEDEGDDHDDHDDHEEPEVTPPADHDEPEEPEQTPPPTGGAAAMGSVGGLAIAVLGALAL